MSHNPNFAQTTTITRDTQGNPTEITAPNGQVTTLTVDENGDLVEVKYEDNAKYAFTYFDGSLMDKMIDPNGNEILHFFDENGRIVLWWSVYMPPEDWRHEVKAIPKV